MSASDCGTPMCGDSGMCRECAAKVEVGLAARAGYAKYEPLGYDSQYQQRPVPVQPQPRCTECGSLRGALGDHDGGRCKDCHEKRWAWRHELVKLVPIVGLRFGSCDATGLLVVHTLATEEALEFEPHTDVDKMRPILVGHARDLRATNVMAQIRAGLTVDKVGSSYEDGVLLEDLATRLMARAGVLLKGPT